MIVTFLLALNRDEEELTGSEDPSVLHSVVANLPAQQAYKEGENVFEGTPLKWILVIVRIRKSIVDFFPCTRFVRFKQRKSRP